MDSAATRVSCAIQLEIGHEYPEYARLLKPVPCKGTHQNMGGQALLFEAQNRGRSRPRCSADRLHRRRSFLKSAEKSRRDKLLVVAGTRTRDAYQVPLWKVCQAIWWTSRYWFLGSFDRRLARASSVAAQSRLVTMGSCGVSCSCSPNGTRKLGATSSGYTTTVLTKCAANVWPIGPIVRSQTCARMQRGESPRNNRVWDFYKVRPKTPVALFAQQPDLQ